MKLEEMRKMMTEAEHSGHWPYALMRRNFEKLLDIAEAAKEYSIMGHKCDCGYEKLTKAFGEFENEKA